MNEVLSRARHWVWFYTLFYFLFLIHINFCLLLLIGIIIIIIIIFWESLIGINCIVVLEVISELQSQHLKNKLLVLLVVEHKIQIETRKLKQKLKVEKFKTIDHGYYLKRSSTPYLRNLIIFCTYESLHFFFSSTSSLRKNHA